ncbi:CDP-diacylglycerol-glycerol-3-phosphate 3-phosphatidyltransferase [Phellopilus nigrolimitatus]|nr:CDP-diacylglycerol-glycerol-3-phosphate 3-phosphatidyltransferase [Phellopilus nigrolimitatus]
MRACWTLAKRIMSAQRLLSSKAMGKLPAIQHLHPIVRDFTVELGQSQPCFSLQTRNVQILFQPKDFRVLLLDMVRRARKRIFLSSLYIGSSEKYLKTRCVLNPTLHVHLHLDYNRSTRPGPASTASLLSPLVKLYPDRVHAHLFKSPKLKGVAAKTMPRRFDEGWGTWHAKIYGVDEEVLITGANLSETYFTDRQDRYLHFESPSLSEYCFSFLQTMKPYCFELKAGEPYLLSWPTPSLHPEHIEKVAGKALRALQMQQTQSSLANFEKGPPNDNDVLIFPIIQAGQFGIREEEQSLNLLFKHLDIHAKSNGGNPLVDLTSGYFGLYGPYQGFIQQSQADCRVLCASPSANGFLGSSGISGRIPEGYTLLEQRFWRGVQRFHREWREGHGVQLHEWKKDGWTYHAKGLWVSPSHDSTGEGEAPVLTLFGSTNLNSRSANLDTELAFIMVVPSSEDKGVHGLREQLGGEVRGLRKHAIPWRGQERNVRLGTKALVGLVEGML